MIGAKSGSFPDGSGGNGFLTKVSTRMSGSVRSSPSVRHACSMHLAQSPRMRSTISRQFDLRRWNSGANAPRARPLTP